VEPWFPASATGWIPTPTVPSALWFLLPTAAILGASAEYAFPGATTRERAPSAVLGQGQGKICNREIFQEVKLLGRDRKLTDQKKQIRCILEWIDQRWMEANKAI
jgi:hypothetical protein